MLKGLALAFGLLACALSVSRVQANAPQGFIRAQANRFVDKNCKEFNFVGTNAWRMVQMAAGLYPFDNGSGWPTTKAGLDFLIRPEAPKRGYMNPALWAIREMQQSNLTVLRVFGTGADSTFAFVTEPGTAGADGTTWPDGTYNWDFVFGLEQIVEWCRAHGVKVMFTVLDNWSPVDSKTAFVNFANKATGGSLGTDDFWSDPLVMKYYKNHLSFLLNHPNKLANNLQFKDDPTIIGWNLFNEPRCNCVPTIISPTTNQITAEAPGSNCGQIKTCTANMKAWVAEMAAFAKKIAPKQLLGVGDEGFATNLNNQDSSALVASNPGPWAVYVGDSFSIQSAKGIDYHSTHLWVDNWGVAVVDSSSDASVAMSAPKADGSSFAFDRLWLSARNAAAAADGRPFVIEEFGKFVPRPVTQNDADIEKIRDPWFEEAFSQTMMSIKAGEPLRAIMIWKYAVTPINNATDKNWVTVEDTTWTNIIRPYAEKIYNIRPAVKNCKPGAMISTTTVTAAVSSQRSVARATRQLQEGEAPQVYVTRGDHLLATKAGKTIGEEILDVAGPWVCAAACQMNPLCSSFNYNKDRAMCTLQRDAGNQVAFNQDGWQSFWHEDQYKEWDQKDGTSVGDLMRSMLRPWL